MLLEESLRLLVPKAGVSHVGIRLLLAALLQIDFLALVAGQFEIREVPTIQFRVVDYGQMQALAAEKW